MMVAGLGIRRVPVRCRDCHTFAWFTLLAGEDAPRSFLCLDCLRRRSRPVKDYPHE